MLLFSYYYFKRLFRVLRSKKKHLRKWNLDHFFSIWQDRLVLHIRFKIIHKESFTFDSIILSCKIVYVWHFINKFSYKYMYQIQHKYKCYCFSLFLYICMYALWCSWTRLRARHAGTTPQRRLDVPSLGSARVVNIYIWAYDVEINIQC